MAQQIFSRQVPGDRTLHVIVEHDEVVQLEFHNENEYIIFYNDKQFKDLLDLLFEEGE